jgi:hypothetical protein
MEQQFAITIEPMVYAQIEEDSWQEDRDASAIVEVRG